MRKRFGLGDGAHAGVDVGQPAHLLLQVGAGGGDHLGVEAEAGHHQEDVVVDAARRRRSTRCHAQVDGRSAPVKAMVIESSRLFSGSCRLRASRLPVPDRQHARAAPPSRAGPRRPRARCRRRRRRAPWRHPGASACRVDPLARVLLGGLEPERSRPSRPRRPRRPRPGATWSTSDLHRVVRRPPRAGRLRWMSLGSGTRGLPSQRTASTRRDQAARLLD